MSRASAVSSREVLVRRSCIRRITSGAKDVAGSVMCLVA